MHQEDLGHRSRVNLNWPGWSRYKDVLPPPRMGTIDCNAGPIQ